MARVVADARSFERPAWAIPAINAWSTKMDMTATSGMSASTKFAT
jgi:hypothetical protein